MGDSDEIAFDKINGDLLAWYVLRCPDGLRGKFT